MAYIASTLTCDNRYVEWHRGGDGRLIEGKSVLIKGGYKLANKNFTTVGGAVITEVSDEELELLKKNTSFKQHMDGGFVRILDRKIAPERAEHDMTKGDKSQQLTPGHFSKKDPNKPETLSVNTGPV